MSCAKSYSGNIDLSIDAIAGTWSVAVSIFRAVTIITFAIAWAIAVATGFPIISTERGKVMTVVVEVKLTKAADMARLVEVGMDVDDSQRLAP